MTTRDAVFVVLGATGKTGRSVAELLLDSGATVRVVGRDPGKLEPLARRGASPFVGSLEDPKFVRGVFEGATAAYTLLPPNPGAADFFGYQVRTGKVIAEGIRGSRVRYVVNLSSIGADLPSRNGPVRGLYELEQRFGELEDVNVLHLRPTMFMENNLFSIPAIKAMGAIASPLRPEVALNQIAARDIAAVAARRLSVLDFGGKGFQELLGPRAYTMPEVARILGAAIGKPDLPYVQVSYEEAEKAMTDMGLPAQIAGLYVEMYRGFNEGLIKPTRTRDASSTTPTTLEEFGKSFAQAFQG